MEYDEDSDRLGKRKLDARPEADDLFVKSEDEESSLDEDEGLSNHPDGIASDDEDEDEDDAEYECSYEEYGEPWPRCVAYDKDFQQLGRDLSSLPAGALRVIDMSGCSSQRAVSLRKNADELTRAPRATREKIALLGNTGAGKSSLLNSLLDRPGLARAVAAAESCTYVCTEYECPFPGQKTELAARVEYYDPPAIRSLLKSLLNDYCRWNFERPEDLDKEEEMELKQRMQSAHKTFRSLFCDKQQLESTRAAQEFFQQAYEGSLDALSIMTNWCEEMLEERDDYDEQEMGYIAADTQKELIQKLKPLTTGSSRFEKPAYWPLVKKVRVGIEGPRILEYVILVDLPGLDDTNAVRVNASYDTMRSCDQIWVVAKIARVTTDTAVDSLLLRYGKDYDMTVVCTGIDQDTQGLAREMYDKGQSLQNHGELVKAEKALRKAVDQAKRQRQALKTALASHNRGQSGNKRRKLTQDDLKGLRAKLDQANENLELVEKDHEDTKQEKFEVIVDVRNSYATRRLREDKKEHIGAGKDLTVFCVSNSHYNVLKGRDEMVKPCLSAESTGVPALREHILRRAAPAQLAKLEEHIYHRYEVFMQGLALWAKSYNLDGSDELLEEVAAPQEKVNDAVRTYLGELLEVFGKFITGSIRANLREIVSNALRDLDRKRRLHWCSIRAFLRRGGNHRTSVVPQSSWNEDFLAGAKTAVEQSWDAFTQGFQKLSVQLENDLVKLVGDIHLAVKDHPAYYVLPTERLEELFEAQQLGISHACNKHRDDIAKNMRNVKLGLTQERPDGYFTQVMEQAYTRANNTTGTGYKVRVLTIFETILSLPGSQSPFSLMCKGATHAISKDTPGLNDELAGDVTNILQNIQQQIGDLVRDRVEDESEERLSRAFAKFLGTNEPRFEDMKIELKRVKRRYGL